MKPGKQPGVASESDKTWSLAEMRAMKTHLSLGGQSEQLAVHGPEKWIVYYMFNASHKVYAFGLGPTLLLRRLGGLGLLKGARDRREGGS